VRRASSTPDVPDSDGEGVATPRQSRSSKKARDADVFSTPDDDDDGQQSVDETPVVVQEQVQVEEDELVSDNGLGPETQDLVGFVYQGNEYEAPVSTRGQTKQPASGRTRRSAQPESETEPCVVSRVHCLRS
jgi:hypothetical protein